MYDATAGTVLDRSRARTFAGDVPPAVSLLLARGADARSGAHNASGDDARLHLFAGALDPTSTEADPPDGAAAADGSTDAVDANGAAVPATTTTAASALPPEKKTLNETTLTELKTSATHPQDRPPRGDGTSDQTQRPAAAMETPHGKPMNR